VAEHKKPVMTSVLTCPECGVSKEEEMPADACQFFYDCCARNPVIAASIALMAHRPALRFRPAAAVVPDGALKEVNFESE
jgi:hypothetical protein